MNKQGIKRQESSEKLELRELKILVGISIFATILMFVAIIQGTQETRVQDQTQIKIIENEVKQ